MSWYAVHAKSVQEGTGQEWQSWAEFTGALRKNFAPLDDEEDARHQLKELCQTGRVAGYTAKFNELTYQIPGLTDHDKFSAYYLGLIPRLQVEISLRLEGDSERSVEWAIGVATQAEEYLKIKYSGKEGENNKP